MYRITWYMLVNNNKQKARKTMKTIIIGDQKFTSKATFIDFAGPILATAKEINNQKDALRELGNGNHFGKDFTLTVKAAHKGGGVDVAKLKQLAIDLGATLEQIEDCKTPRVECASAVSFARN